MDLLRIGKVSSIDTNNFTLKVVYEDRDNLVSTDMPILANGINFLPKVDDFVLVAYLSNAKGSCVCLGKVSDVKELIAGASNSLVLDAKDKELVLKNLKGQINLSEILSFEKRIKALESRV